MCDLGAKSAEFNGLDCPLGITLVQKEELNEFSAVH